MKSNQKKIKTILSKNILKMIQLFMAYNFKNLIHIPFLLGTFFHQYFASIKRNAYPFDVPAILIVSITNKCNLSCTSCYSKKHHADSKKVLNTTTFISIIKQSYDLGISIIMLAGGEPLLRKDILEQASHYKKILFPIFTNATLIDEKIILFFKKNKHCIPIISIEGDTEATERRRGKGVIYSIDKAVHLLSTINTFWGYSITVTNNNFNDATSLDFVQSIVKNGAKILFFIEFVPIAVQDEEKVLTTEQRFKLQNLIKKFDHIYKSIFITLPGNEEQYDGCLAAGRGFIHINPEGNVEACPFAPFADKNITKNSLMDALQSPMMTAIRENHNKLSEAKGGCTLWTNKEWVKKIQSTNTEI